MKHYEEKTVTETKKTHVKTTCDVCGGEIPFYAEYNYAEASISYETGTRSRSGGCCERFAPDICGKCFAAVVIPALQAAGVTVKYEESDW
jgi:hypothetical protein